MDLGVDQVPDLVELDAIGDWLPPEVTVLVILRGTLLPLVRATQHRIPD